MTPERSSAAADPDAPGKGEGWPAVVITDPCGVVTYWNETAERIYGWSATEAVGRQILELSVHPPGVAVAEDIVASMAAATGWEGRFRVRSKDGAGFEVWATDAPLLGPGGDVVG